MPKVYVLSNTGHDYSTANKFGDVVVIDRKFPFFNPQSSIGVIAKELKDFTIEDYFLVDGSPIMSLYVFWYLSNKFSVIKVLFYDAKNQEYIYRKLDNEVL